MATGFNSHIERYGVRYSDIGANGKLTLDALCHYLQDSAGKHAHALGVSVPQLLPQGMTWILSKLRVEMEALPAWREEIIIETWPSEIDKRFAIRDFQISDARGQRIGAASTAWLLLNLDKKRPVRIPEKIQKFHPDPPRRALAGAYPKLDGPEVVTHEKRFRARFRDLDFNRHVNNVAYILWLIECMPLDFSLSHVPVTLAVEFRAECLYEEDVTAQAEIMPSHGNEIPARYRLLHCTNGKELVLADIKWRQIPESDGGSG